VTVWNCVSETFIGDRCDFQIGTKWKMNCSAAVEWEQCCALQLRRAQIVVANGVAIVTFTLRASPAGNPS
jgi:N-formylglutamate amidohydrolase